MTNEELAQLLAWRELALRFLDSASTPPALGVVMANCILDFPGPFPKTRLRHHAWMFVAECRRLIEQKGAGARCRHMDESITLWVQAWDEMHGVGH